MHLDRWRRRRDDRGAVLILGALFAAVAIVAAALSVDIGSLALSKRANQRIADLASLDGVRGLSVAPPQRDDVERIVLASVERNGFDIDPTTAARSCTPLLDSGATYTTPDALRWVTIELGKYTVGADDNFAPVKCPAAAAVEALLPVDADAVRVIVSSPVSFNFMPGGGRETASAVSKLGTTTPAVATTTTILTTTTTTPPSASGLAGLWVGSRFASIDTSRSVLLNSILEQAIDPNSTTAPVVNVSAAGYQGLASSNVTLTDLATELGINAGTVDDILNAQVSYADVLAATATILNRDGNAAAATVNGISQGISTTAGQSQTITLGELGSISGNGSVLNGSSVADATFNVLDLVRGGALLADGNHLVSATVPPASVPLPTGAVSATVDVQVIEAPQAGGPGPALTTSAHTAQVRSTIHLQVPVNVVGLGVVNVDLPIDVQGGGADATITDIACAVGATTPSKVSINAVSRTLIGTVGAFVSSVLAGTVTITGSQSQPVSSTAPPALLDFLPAFATKQTTPVSQLGALSVSPSSITVSGPLGLGLTAATVATTIATTLNGVLGQLNTAVTPVLYDALGVSFADADVWVMHGGSLAGPGGGPDPTCTTTPGSTGTTTTTTPAPTTTVAPSYAGVPVLVD